MRARAASSLTTLGFGEGNYNDALMEQIADVGNGNYGYVDSLKEAKRLLVDQLSGTIQTIAKDVKIQIEFNPAVVAEYRLIGYENRALQPRGLQQRQEGRGRDRRRPHRDRDLRDRAQGLEGPGGRSVALRRATPTRRARSERRPSSPSCACATRRRMATSPS